MELFQNDIKKMVDGKLVVQKGEVRRYWHQAERYPKETIDPGDFWDLRDNSYLCLATPEGLDVLDSSDMLSERLEIGDMHILDEAYALEPGQWVEREDDDWYRTGCRVRATAYAELPPLSAEQTIRASDLSDQAKARIRINGKPLYAPGTMKNGNSAWFPKLRDFIMEAALGALRDKGGPGVDVSASVMESYVGHENTLFLLVLTAGTRNELVGFLRNIGVTNPETVKIQKTEGGPGEMVRTVQARVVLNSVLL